MSLWKDRNIPSRKFLKWGGMFTYALIQQVRYAGLTDGNLWVLDNVAEFSGGERRLLQVSIANEPAHQCALKFLLLWRPNLASGQPVAASEPVLTTASDTEPAIAPTPVKLGGEGWVSLADFQLGTGNQPPEIHLPDGTEKQLRYWYQILAETAEWLIRTGLITADRCPMRNSGRISIVHTEPRHESENNKE